MAQNNEPLVSVVTPVYDGEKYIAECIKSVLEQTYSNWEYIILNNCSTDDTLKIAEQYAASDKRIKVITTDEFLKQIPNWNEALRKISSDSKYCKVIHADDWLFPECIEKMVAKAEQHPSAGIISAYRLMGSKVRGLRGEGLPYEIDFMTGKEAGRRVLLTPLFLFGSPSSIMYRSYLIRKNQPFYDPSVVHADTDACFDILQESDFGFVHQILSFTRIHDEATSVFTEYYHTHSLFDLYAVKKYGDYYLTPEEYDQLLSEKIENHHRWLVKLMFEGRGKDVWKYHKQELEKMNIGINRYIILREFLFELAKIKPLAKWVLNQLEKLTASTEIRDNIQSKKENTVAASTE